SEPATPGARQPKRSISHPMVPVRGPSARRRTCAGRWAAACSPSQARSVEEGVFTKSSRSGASDGDCRRRRGTGLGDGRDGPGGHKLWSQEFSQPFELAALLGRLAALMVVEGVDDDLPLRGGVGRATVVVVGGEDRR